MPKNILIAEDEKALARALSLKLIHEGFTVSIAEDGQQCLDLLKTATFDVILLDMMMPVVDGFQVLEKLQAFPVKPTVIVLSNLSQKEDEERVLALGANRYFIKSDVSLARIVEEIMKE